MIHAPEAPVFKALLLISSLLLIGIGIIARHLEPRIATRWHWGIRIGAVILITSSLVDLGFTAWRALLEINPYLYGAYLTNSRHGQWVMVRVVSAVVLWWLSVKPRAELNRLPNANKIDIGLHSLASIALGLSISMTTHSGASNQVLPIFGDLMHLFAMYLWISGVALLAIHRFSPKDGIEKAKLISSVAAWSVAALTLTGVYQSLIKLWSPALLVETQYGATLSIKLFLYALVLGFAAMNRWYWMPQLEKRQNLFVRFQAATRIELALLCTVLLATATLGSTAPPERDVRLIQPIEVEEKQNIWLLKAKGITPAIGGLRLTFQIIPQPGYKLEPDARLDLNLIMPADGMSLRQNPTRKADGTYYFETRLGMPGQWKLLIKIPGAKWEIPFEVTD